MLIQHRNRFLITHRKRFYFRFDVGGKKFKIDLECDLNPLFSCLTASVELCLLLLGA